MTLTTFRSCSDSRHPSRDKDANRRRELLEALSRHTSAAATQIEEITFWSARAPFPPLVALLQRTRSRELASRGTSHPRA